MQIIQPSVFTYLKFENRKYLVYGTVVLFLVGLIYNWAWAILIYLIAVGGRYMFFKDRLTRYKLSNKRKKYFLFSEIIVMGDYPNYLFLEDFLRDFLAINWDSIKNRNDFISIFKNINSDNFPTLGLKSENEPYVNMVKHYKLAILNIENSNLKEKDIGDLKENIEEISKFLEITSSVLFNAEMNQSKKEMDDILGKYGL